LKRTEHWRRLKRFENIFESVLGKREKVMERSGMTEKETSQWYLPEEKKATRKWNRENRR
jgi:hypothetical protein